MSHLSPPLPKQGFSLIELSIVLVIIGLLVGGVLAGRDLIRAAEIRNITSQLEEYRRSVNAFRGKYLGLPGDISNATQFWGAAPACPGTAGTGTQTCDGNGDKLLSLPAAADQYGESFLFWQHLANAQMIEGEFTGIAGPGSDADVVPSVNVPELNIGNQGMIHILDRGSASSHSLFFDGYYGNTFGLGGDHATNLDGDQPVISAKDAWDMDVKIDDEMPATGSVRSYKNTARPNCASDDTINATYQVLNETSTACNLMFKAGF